MSGTIARAAGSVTRNGSASGDSASAGPWVLARRLGSHSRGVPVADGEVRIVGDLHACVPRVAEHLEVGAQLQCVKFMEPGRVLCGWRSRFCDATARRVEHGGNVAFEAVRPVTGSQQTVWRLSDDGRESCNHRLGISFAANGTRSGREVENGMRPWCGCSRGEREREGSESGSFHGYLRAQHGAFRVRRHVGFVGPSLGWGFIFPKSGISPAVGGMGA